jgi:hypothetical protein
MQLVNALGQPGKYIWTEFRCPNVVPETGICGDCKIKLPKYKYQSNQKCDHGIVGGPYPTDSKLYGSPYYEKQIKEGWILKPEDELRAKEAVTKATSDMPRKKVVPNNEVAPNNEVVPVPSTVVVPPVKEKKPRAKKEKKDTPQVISAPVIQPVHEPKYSETMTPTIYVDEADVIRVKVIKQKISGKEYYLDRSTGKVYASLVNGVGEYKGRYKDEALDTTYPDSDVE